MKRNCHDLLIQNNICLFHWHSNAFWSWSEVIKCLQDSHLIYMSNEKRITKTVDRRLHMCSTTSLKLSNQSFLYAYSSVLLSLQKDNFGLYALYSKNKPLSDQLLLEHGNEFFRTKQRELGDKMDLASYLLKPVQRMGKLNILKNILIEHIKLLLTIDICFYDTY